MNPIKRILCAYDFSSLSDKAIDLGISLAQTCSAELNILSVLDNPYLYDNSNPIIAGNILALDLVSKIKEEMKEKFESFEMDLRSKFPELSMKFLIQEAFDISENILDTQKKSSIDLIIMGSHGRSGFKRVLLGSIAESVLRDATCPVLIVK